MANFSQQSAVSFLQLLQAVHVNHQPAPFFRAQSLKAAQLPLQQPLPSNEYYLLTVATQQANDTAEPLKLPVEELFQ